MSAVPDRNPPPWEASPLRVPDLTELMAIERQVNELTAEIEQLEGGFKRLGDQVAYSTLTVNLSLPGSTDRTGYDLGGALSDFLANVRDFF